MKRSRTLFLILGVMIFYSFILSVSVTYADSPAPPSYFYSVVTNTDPNAKYTDILIKINKGSEYYTDLNTSNAAVYHFNKLTPIVAYNQDGYVSISFHCRNVRLYPNSQASLRISGIIELADSNKPINTIGNSIKIAQLDQNGNVLEVSDAVSVSPTANDTFPRDVRYDASSKTPKVEFVNYYKTNLVHNASFLAFLSFAFLIRMVISTAIETLIAVPFKIKPLWKIVATNIVTQILLCALITFGGLGYINSVIAGEIFVFISEFVAYIFLFKHISKPKLALYTVIANTASLAAGLIFNTFHVFVR